MRKAILILIVIWINAGLLSGCTSSLYGGKKAKILGTEMPSMKTIHDEKFHQANDKALIRPHRPVDDDAIDTQEVFQWLPNPTLRMYVFKHLTGAGNPVPGYSTFFRLYTRDHIAAPGEQGGWQ